MKENKQEMAHKWWFKCEGCLCRHFYDNLERNYIITSLDERTEFIEVKQYDSKGEEVYISNTLLPPKKKRKKKCS